MILFSSGEEGVFFWIRERSFVLLKGDHLQSMRASAPCQMYFVIDRAEGTAERIQTVFLGQYGFTSFNNS
jgi:hypothetical protein